MGQITELAREINENAREKGFYPKRINYSDPIWISNRLMLVVSELAEGLEAIRKPCEDYEWILRTQFDITPKSGGLGEELSDAVIRILDLAFSLGIDIEKGILDKMAYNKTREYKHGGKSL